MRYDSGVTSILIAYAAGALVGLWRADGPPLTRLTMAATWPLGVLAAGVTTIVLLAAAAVLFPAFGVALSGGLLLAWWASTY